MGGLFLNSLGEDLQQNHQPVTWFNLGVGIGNRAAVTIITHILLMANTTPQETT